MALVSRRQDLARIEQELQDPQYLKMFRRLRKRCGACQDFKDWSDLMAFVRKRDTPEDARNEVLRALVEAYQRDSDNPWSTVLLGAFWLILESIHVRRRHWEHDDEERWQKIIEIFLIVLRRFDLTWQHQRFLKRVANLTVHKLHKRYTRIWRNDQVVSPRPAEELVELAGGKNDPTERRIQISDEKDVDVARFTRNLERKLISKQEFNLLMATRIAGINLKEYAKLKQMPYQTLKKRRQRAESKLRFLE